MRKIRVYTGNYGSEKYWLKYLVHPVRAFWGDGTKDWPKWEDDFHFYKKYFILVDTPEKSDVGFLPLTLNYYVNNRKLKLVNEMADLMEENDKALYVWIDGDHKINYFHSNCIFIKYFSDQTTKGKNELIQPGDLKTDLLAKYFEGQFQPRDKSNLPVIGFDGIAKYPKYKLVGTIAKNALQHLSFKLMIRQTSPDPIIPFLLKRKKLLDQFNQPNKLKTNFTIRDSFAPGTIGRNDQAREEFINNIIGSDYTFCFRGAANYSLRFYETLCLGRIPLFINTNSVLPFENKIEWKNIVLWIDENETDYMVEKILDFHQSLTNNQFIEKQKYCREIWKTYLSKEGFIKHFNDSIKQSILSGVPV